MKGLEGRTALVTGGSRGIGRAIVLELAKEGANVAFTYVTNRERAISVLSLIEKMEKTGKIFQADVSSFKEAEEVVNETVEEFGGIDILVNNAGINRDRVIWKMTEEDWDLVINTDLKGCFNYIKAVVPIMREKGYGRIVNIISINALRGKFGQSNYSAAKAGVIGLTKSCAKELGKYGITVNAVAPGLIETDMLKSAPPEVRDMALAEIVLKRIGQPEDVANLVAFLVSDKARHITGEVIKVDGGQYI